MNWLGFYNLANLKELLTGSSSDPNWERHDSNDNMLQVKAGDDVHLVEVLTMDRSNEEDDMADGVDLDRFTREFFLTYTSFMQPKRFLELLKERLEAIWEDSGDSSFDKEVADRRTVVLAKVVITWIKLENAAVFAKDADLCKAMMKWLDGHLAPVSKKAFEAIRLAKEAEISRMSGNIASKKELMEEAKDKDEDENLHTLLDGLVHMTNAPPMPEPDGTTAKPPATMKKRDGTAGVDVIDLDTDDLARQMTLMESTIVRRIRTCEFHKTAWTKRNAIDLAPNLTRAIQLSNHFTNWLVTEILKLRTFEQMSDLIMKFIKLGKAFQAIYNWSGVMQVVSALNNSAISKLKGAWALIPPKMTSAFEELNTLVSPLGHYKLYRVAFADRPAGAPCLPILAVTLSDLNGFEEVFTSTTADGAVNWTKMSRVSARIWEVISLPMAYDFKAIPWIQVFVKEGGAWYDSLTTCAVADMRVREIAKAAAEKEKEKERRSSSKRKSASLLGDALIGGSSGSAGPNEMARDSLTEREWAFLTTGTDGAKTYNAGQVVLVAGAPNNSLFYIKSGKVKVIKQIGDSPDQLREVAQMDAGHMFGEVSMLLRAQKEGGATASILAAVDGTEIFVLPIDHVLAVLASKPGLAERLNRILGIRLARRLRDLGKQQAASAQALTSSNSSSSLDPKPSVSASETEAIAKATAALGVNAVPQKNSAPEKKEKKSVFYKTFDFIPGEETVIQQYHCSRTKRSDDGTAAASSGSGDGAQGGDLSDAGMNAHGMMYVTQNYLCFSTSLFGAQKANAWHFSSVSEWKKKTRAGVTTIRLSVTQGSCMNTSPVTSSPEDESVVEWTVAHLSQSEDAYNLVAQMRQHHQTHSGTSGHHKSKSSSSKEIKEAKEAAAAAAKEAKDASVNPWLPSAADWNLILKGARTTTFKKDDIVMKEGEATTRVFQLVAGECRFEKMFEGESRILGKMSLSEGSGADNLFGEISFLEGGKASASVVCNKDDTSIAIIEDYWLDVIFQYYPEIAGKFYHYLANVLSKRLKQRESAAAAAQSQPAAQSTPSSLPHLDAASKDAEEGHEVSSKKKRDKKKEKKEKSHKRKSDTRQADDEEPSDKEE